MMRHLHKILVACFVVFWMFFVFLDYWQKHPVYYYAFQRFEQWGLSIFLLLLGAGVTWGVQRSLKQKNPPRYINGLSVFGLSLVIGVASVGFAYGKVVEGGGFNVPKAAHVFGLLLGTSAAVYTVVAAGKVLGGMINGWLKVAVKAEDALVIDIATGFMGITLVLFLLGTVSLLHSFLVFPLLAVLFLLGRKQAFSFLRASLWQPIALDKGLNAWGIAGFYLLLCLTTINFTAVNVSMPAGFDALTLYANLPSLIGQHHALVKGFQPYNWSLLMSLGHILFGSTAVSLAISWLGGTLSLFALYALCRHWLKTSVNQAAFAVLAFALTPAFTIQASAELKVDLGLLFAYLSILLVLLNFFKKTTERKQEAAPVGGFFGAPELLLLGLLTGFSLGIKLTTLFFAFSLVCAIWYLGASKRGFFAAFLTCLFLVFFLKIDDFGGLRQFHLGVDRLQWGVLLAAVFLLVGVFVDNRQNWLQCARATVVYGLFAALPFLPWMVKNLVESGGAASMQQILNGVDASPSINLGTLEKQQ